MVDLTNERQKLREEYMERIYKFGNRCSEVTEQANRWWPGTTPTTWEKQDTHLDTYIDHLQE